MNITIPYYEDNTRISNSSLGWFKISPRYFKDKLDGKVQDEKVPVFETGTMIHMYILQPDEFWDNYVILNYETPKSKEQRIFCETYAHSTELDHDLRLLEAFNSAYRANGKSDNKKLLEAKEIALKYESYIKYLDIQNKTVISYADLTKLRNISDSINNHKKAKELLTNIPSLYESNNEFHINWDYSVKVADNNFILPCKSLLDRLVINHKEKLIRLIDLKTTSDISNFNIKSFWKFDYGRQLAFYKLAIRWYFKNELKLNFDEYTIEYYIIAIETINNNEIRVFKIHEDIINNSTVDISQIMTEINWHIQNNLWDHRIDYYKGDGSEVITLYDNKGEV
jgi:hypothetical protein